MIYTRFGTPVKFKEAQQVADGRLFVRAESIVSGRCIGGGNQLIRITKFQADGGLGEIVQTAMSLVPYHY